MTASGEDPAAPKGVPRDKEQPAPKRESVRPSPANGTEQIVFTMRATTGEVVKIEKIEADGKRHDFSKEETAGLVGKTELSEIEGTLDEAFEAGIHSVLEPDREVEESARTEDEDETALRRALLTVIVGAGVRRRLQRRIVQRLLLSRAVNK